MRTSRTARTRSETELPRPPVGFPAGAGAALNTCWLLAICSRKLRFALSIALCMNARRPAMHKKASMQECIKSNGQRPAEGWPSSFIHCLGGMCAISSPIRSLSHMTSFIMKAEAARHIYVCTKEVHGPIEQGPQRNQAHLTLALTIRRVKKCNKVTWNLHTVTGGHSAQSVLKIGLSLLL